MIQYIALLRGINVGGHRLIKMKDLSEYFTAMGFADVKTYIQSGNVFLKSPENDPKALRLKIEKELEKVLGYAVPVVLRTKSEMQKIVEKHPFPPAAFHQEIKLYVSFLSDIPEKSKKEALMALNNDKESLIVQEEELYCFVAKDLAKPLFSNNYIEKKLGVLATTRNWGVTNQILDLFD